MPRTPALRPDEPGPSSVPRKSRPSKPPKHFLASARMSGGEPIPFIRFTEERVRMVRRPQEAMAIAATRAPPSVPSKLLPPLPPPNSSNPSPPPQVGTFSGPIAAAEFERMKKEIESLKKAATESKKLAKKQSKIIEDLKAELSTARLSHKENELHVQVLQTKNRTNEELISSIEASLQCQICMDLLSKPYACHPCGHVLCLTCLQEWFRKAPPSASDDDMEVDPEDDADYIKHRAKSCPCCRATIVKRPVPVFMVKAITSALSNAKSNQNALREASPSPTDRDPWKGLFPDDDESDNPDYYDGDEDDIWSDEEGFTDEDVGFVPYFLHEPVYFDDEDDESEGGDDWYHDPNDFAYGPEDYAEEVPEEEEEEEEGQPEEYDLPEWAPAEYIVDARSVARSDRVPLYRRGCSDDLCDFFGITYNHNDGLIAHVNSLIDVDWQHRGFFTQNHRRRMCRVFLGFNIHLGDQDARAYMLNTLRDIRENPERWRISPRPHNVALSDARRLVRVDDIVEYASTDDDD